MKPLKELIDKKLFDVVLEAYRRSFSVQSDYARAKADYVAMAASLGYISTKVHNNVYSRDWRPTVKGLSWLEAQDVDILEEEYLEAPEAHDNN